MGRRQGPAGGGERAAPADNERYAACGRELGCKDSPGSGGECIQGAPSPGTPGGRGGRGRTPDQAGDPQPTLGGALSSAPSYARTPGVGGIGTGGAGRAQLHAATAVGGRRQLPGQRAPRMRGRGGGEGFAPLAFPAPPSTSNELLALHSRVIQTLNFPRPTSSLDPGVHRVVVALRVEAFLMWEKEGTRVSSSPICALIFRNILKS